MWEPVALPLRALYALYALYALQTLSTVESRFLQVRHAARAVVPLGATSPALFLFSGVPPAKTGICSTIFKSSCHEKVSQ